MRPYNSNTMKNSKIKKRAQRKINKFETPHQKCNHTWQRSQYLLQLPQACFTYPAVTRIAVQFLIIYFSGFSLAIQQYLSGSKRNLLSYSRSSNQKASQYKATSMDLNHSMLVGSLGIFILQSNTIEHKQQIIVTDRVEEKFQIYTSQSTLSCIKRITHLKKYSGTSLHLLTIICIQNCSRYLHFVVEMEMV